jgi:hypothetical protein
VVGGGGGRRTTEDCPEGTGRSCGIISSAGLTIERRGAAGGSAVATGAETLGEPSGGGGLGRTCGRPVLPVTGRKRGTGASATVVLAGVGLLGLDAAASGAFLAAGGGGAATLADAALAFPAGADFKSTLRTRSAI